MGANLNKAIAIAIIIIAIVLGGLWIVFVAFIPEKALLLIDNAEIKFLMILVGDIFIILIGIFAYYFFHMPRPRRLILLFFNVMLVSSILGSGAPLGLSAIEAYTALSGNTEAWFEFKIAGPSSAVIFVCGAVICYLTSREYTRIAKYERKNGSLY